MIILTEDGKIIMLENMEIIIPKSDTVVVFEVGREEDEEPYILGDTDDKAHAIQIVVEIYKEYRAGSRGETFEELATRARGALVGAKDEQKDIYAPLLEDAQAGDKGPTK